MRSEFERAVRERQAEVDAEAARLVRAGEAPWVAASKAAENVRNRRRMRRIVEAFDASGSAVGGAHSGEP